MMEFYEKTGEWMKAKSEIQTTWLYNNETILFN